MCVYYLEKRRKDKQSLPSSSTVKKPKTNSRNKENIVEVIELEDHHAEHQKKLNNLAQEKLMIQKQTNDELEREIQLLEKRNQLLGL